MTYRLTRMDRRLASSLPTQQAPQHQSAQPVVLSSNLKTTLGMRLQELMSSSSRLKKKTKRYKMAHGRDTTEQSGSSFQSIGVVRGTDRMAQWVQRLAAKTNSLNWDSRPTRWEENSKSYMLFSEFTRDGASVFPSHSTK